MLARRIVFWLFAVAWLLAGTGYIVFLWWRVSDNRIGYFALLTILELQVAGSVFVLKLLWPWTRRPGEQARGFPVDGDDSDLGG